MQGAWETAGAAECEWWQVQVNKLLFVDDTALVADLEEKLRRLSCSANHFQGYSGWSYQHNTG